MLLTRNKILSLDTIDPFLSQGYIPRKLVKREFLVSFCVGVASRYTISILHISIYLRKAASWK